MKSIAKGPSITVEKRAAIEMIKAVSARTPGAIRLESGVPNFPTPEHIVDAACKAARDGYTKYTPSAGLLTLRELIADKLERVNKYRVVPENITVTKSPTWRASASRSGGGVPGPPGGGVTHPLISRTRNRNPNPRLTLSRKFDREFMLYIFNDQYFFLSSGFGWSPGFAGSPSFFSGSPSFFTGSARSRRS